MNAAMLFERADEVVLPAVYRFVARSFNATPSQARRGRCVRVSDAPAACMTRTLASRLSLARLCSFTSCTCCPAQLGYITLARSLMQALSSPLGGFLGAQPKLAELRGSARACVCLGRTEPAAAPRLMPAPVQGTTTTARGSSPAGASSGAW